MTTIARAVLGGALRHHRGRLALSVLAIALGVALGFAVALVNASAVGEFEAAVTSLAGSADLSVRGPRAGFDEDVYAAVARDPDIAVASPVVEADARIEGRDDALRIYGVDAFRAAAVTPALFPVAREALDVLRPGLVFLTPAAQAWLGLREGDTLRVQSGLESVSLLVAGHAEAPAGERYGVMDIAAVQDAFARAGRISRIDLRLRPGARADDVRARLEALLPPGVAVTTPRDEAATTTRMSRAYRVNLNVLALVALFTGALLVFSTQALSVVRRRAYFALLRTLGMTRASLARWLVLEGALAGLAGALLGIAGGYLIAYAVLRFMGADLGAGFFRGVAPRIVIDPWAACVFVLAGVAAAALGSLGPAREAARARPAAALKAGDEGESLSRLRSPWPGIATLATGAALTLAPPLAGLPIAGYLAIALLLVGTLLLLPRLAAFALARIDASRPVPVALAVAQLRSAAGQASVSLATIVASVSLMVSMAIMIASFRQSLDDWLVRVLPADLYVRAASAGDTAFLSPAEQRSLAAVPGVERVSFLRAQSVLLDPSRPRVALLARDLPKDDPGSAIPLVGDAYALRAGDPPPAWITEALADLLSLRPGARLDVPIAGATRTFVVAGVWRDYARQQGAILVARPDYIAMTGDDRVTDAALWTSRGIAVDELRTRIEAALPGSSNLAFNTPGEIRTLSLRIFDRTFAVTYALLAVAVLIGLTGLSSAFGALALARRREFGMLRHLGMTRRQIAGMLAAEGFAISALGLAVGLALGYAMSAILVHVVNRQSFHWGMEIHMPWTSLVALTAGLLLASVATTAVSARTAMGRDVVRAVREDW
ncbi:MAG: FtsX-like permease family protein [Burkholderiales bacterium]